MPKSSQRRPPSDSIPVLQEQVAPEALNSFAAVNPAEDLQALDEVLDIDIQQVLGDEEPEYLELDADVLEDDAPAPAMGQTHEFETLLDKTLNIEALEASIKTLNATSRLAPTDTSRFSAQPSPAADEEENPFLPAHLQEKLRQSKAVILQEIQASTESVKASSALLKASSQRKTKPHERSTGEHFGHKGLIDALVAQYLPLIEADLRKRLKEQLSQPDA